MLRDKLRVFVSRISRLKSKCVALTDVQTFKYTQTFITEEYNWTVGKPVMHTSNSELERFFELCRNYASIA